MDPALLANFPLTPPPQGVVSNFTDPETRAPVIIAFIAICLALTWPVFLLRLYSKIFVVGKFSWDDVTSFIAIIGLSIFSGFSLWEMTILGPHGWNIPVIKITPMFSEVSVVVSTLSSSIFAFFTKISLLLLYLQVFAPKTWLRIAAWFGIITCGLVYGGCAITAGVLCVARPGQSWLEVQISPRCEQGYNPVTILLGVFSVVSDVYLFVLPIPILWHLNMSTRKRIGIIAVFGTGIFAIIASAIGLYYRVADAVSTDPVWELPPALLLGIVELSVGIMCASMPYLPPIFRATKNSKRRSLFSSARSLFARFTLPSSRGNEHESEDQASVFRQDRVIVKPGEDMYHSEGEFDHIPLEERASRANGVRLSIE